MSDKFFLGGVTPNGFSTDLGKYVNSKDYFTYILKGGAGTGKSTLMKRIAERFANTEDVTRYFCSSDPDSLDAVVLHSSKAVIIDGTAPHVFDPKYPGVCQKIVDLGFYWDKNMLAKNSDRIIKASDSNKQLVKDKLNSMSFMPVRVDSVQEVNATITGEDYEQHVIFTVVESNGKFFIDDVTEK